MRAAERFRPRLDSNERWDRSLIVAPTSDKRPQTPGDPSRGDLDLSPGAR